MPVKAKGSLVTINFAHPMCRCQISREPSPSPSFSFTAKIQNVTFDSRKKAINVVKRLAARAIIYASLHQ